MSTKPSPKLMVSDAVSVDHLAPVRQSRKLFDAILTASKLFAPSLAVVIAPVLGVWWLIKSNFGPMPEAPAVAAPSQLASQSEPTQPLSYAGVNIEAAKAAVRSAFTEATPYSALPKPRFDNVEARLAYLRWLGSASEKLKPHKSEVQTRIEFLESVWYEANRAGLDPSLVLAIVEVESGFRKYAISSSGARGYMQVSPSWLTLVGDGMPTSSAFHMQTNLRLGCVLLKEYLNMEGGDMFLALNRYRGRSPGDSSYPNEVFGARKKWLMPGEQ